MAKDAGEKMPSNPLSKLVERLRASVRLRGGAGHSDGRLLASFIEQRDETAFAALVHRHGAMVWNVCRRILRDHHDTEDAFQATFLVLVRRAAAVVPREMVGNWLYGVAYQTALKARALLARRRGREKRVKELPEPAVMEQGADRDWQVLLDQELSRLPGKYRVAIVLCDLEGRTRKEASGQVGVPEGTLAARLARGRAMLAKRLTRHGLAFTAGSLVTVLTRDAAACVPVSVVSSTIKAASLCAAGQALVGLVSAEVAAFAEGVLTAMLLSKLKTIVAVLVLMAAGLGIGVWVYAAQTGEPATAQAKGKPEKGTNVKSKELGQTVPIPTKKPSEVGDDKDFIQPGDRLFVRVPAAPGEDSTITGVHRVEPEGTIPLGPLYGRVQVKGLTLVQAEVEIRKHIEKLVINPAVMVTRYDPLAGAGAGPDAAVERRLLRLEEEVRELRVAVEKLQKKQ